MLGRPSVSVIIECFHLFYWHFKVSEGEHNTVSEGQSVFTRRVPLNTICVASPTKMLEQGNRDLSLPEYATYPTKRRQIISHS